MKRINFDMKIIDYEGREVHDTIGVLTLRRLLKVYAGSYVPPDGSGGFERSLTANAIATKIHNCTDNYIDLTEEEYDVIQESVSNPKHVSMIFAYVYKAVKEAVDIESE